MSIEDSLVLLEGFTRIGAFYTFHDIKIACGWVDSHHRYERSVILHA
jgi:hypothetical protein